MDPIYIKDNIPIIKQYIDDNKLLKLKEHNELTYYQKLKREFPEFNSKYPLLFKKIINYKNNDDITFINQFLEIIHKVI
jgi:hypothetical protein